MNKAFQRRWFVLKGNLLFYFEKRGGELLGTIILEGCVIELSEFEIEKYCFNINFPGNRTYVLAADNQELLEDWMKALTCSGFDYMRLMVQELQRQLDELDKTAPETSETETSVPPIPPRRQNPFNKSTGMKHWQGRDLELHLVDFQLFFSQPGNEPSTSNQQVTTSYDLVQLREAPPPPNNRRAFPTNFDTVRFDIVRDDNEFLMFEDQPSKSSKQDDDFNFEMIHEEFGRPIILAMNERKTLKEKAEAPLIFF